MRIGDQLIYAKIREREKAKQEFETAKKEGKSASLLEENRPNVFSMKLANIMPNDEIEIELLRHRIADPDRRRLRGRLSDGRRAAIYVGQ